MRTYKLTIAYDGTNYQGWQRQSDTDRTIQGILEETLENCTGYQVQIDGSGRTDAGVHASGQTASVVLPGKVDTALFTEKMNGCLPPDIRILDVELVKNGFHARKSAGKFMNIGSIRGSNKMYLHGSTAVIFRENRILQG